MATVTPAFPSTVDGGYRGMTLRDYFAARAPLEIPDWFVHIEPAKNYPAMPAFEQLDPIHQETARSWQQDPCYDLPEELEWFGKKVVAHRQGREAWGLEDRRARYLQWRWAYADMMLAERARS